MGDIGDATTGGRAAEQGRRRGGVGRGGNIGRDGENIR